jgi:Flp pilus assembly pilin Flp
LRFIPLGLFGGSVSGPRASSGDEQGLLRSECGGNIVQDFVRYYLNMLALKAGKGQGLVEYALIIVLISIVSIVVMTTLGTTITSVFSAANTALAP